MAAILRRKYDESHKTEIKSIIDIEPVVGDFELSRAQAQLLV